MKKFPKGFLWGAAMSAPQTEGHGSLDGKSASTWDYWFKTAPENFNNNQGPEITSNLYELYKKDCLRMNELNLNSLRTSIAWTRLLPDGKKINPEAVAFYRSYFQEMISHGVEPIVNLFHFDMPMWLMKKGGWENRESVTAFSYYAKTAFELFGDLVKKWTTFNEPMVHIECSYLYQFHYPAIVDFKKAVQAGYHTLMAHTYAVSAFRKTILDGEIGIILNISPAYARSDAAEDQLAKTYSDLLNIKSFLDPTIHGCIPEELIQLLATHDLLPETIQKDKALIASKKIDFVGLNYYQPHRVQAPKKASLKANMPSDFYEPYDWPNKRINPYRGWEIYPQALYDVAIMIRDSYNNIPWFVSENGMGVAEEERFMNKDGVIQDDYRIEFMKEHLDYLHKGIEAGSNCFGYHSWTFIDCWSWLNGYRNRYGFYRVDLEKNSSRTIKKSGLWYREVIQNNGY